MATVTASELEARVGACLEQVRAGEPILIVENGRPIARIMPVKSSDIAEWEKLIEMENQGRIKIYGTGTVPADFWNLPRPADPDGLGLKALLYRMIVKAHALSNALGPPVEAGERAYYPLLELQ